MNSNKQSLYLLQPALFPAHDIQMQASKRIFTETEYRPNNIFLWAKPSSGTASLRLNGNHRTLSSLPDKASSSFNWDLGSLVWLLTYLNSPTYWGGAAVQWQ